MLKDKKILIALAVTVTLAGAVYLVTLCPTVYIGDGGELIAAASCLGIAHPPGYPAYVSAGKLFSMLPAGSVAARLNFMSAFFCVLCVAAVFFSIILMLDKIGGGTKKTVVAAALAGSLFLAFSREFWSGAVAAEVFSLNAFFISLLVLVLFLWDGKNARYPYLAAFIAGLGLTNQVTLLLAAPGVCLYLFMEMKKNRVAVSKSFVARLVLFFFISINR